MRQSKHWLSYVILLLLHLTNANASAQWLAVKRSLQSDVQIVEETATRLVLHHPAFGISLVLTIAPTPEADVYRDHEARRGGNPYRVWVTTEKFWQTALLAEDAGNKFFQASFAKTLRRPLEKSKLPLEQNLQKPPAVPMPYETIAETAKPRSTVIQPPLTLEMEPVLAMSDSTAVPMPTEEYIQAPSIDSSASRMAALDNRGLDSSPQNSSDERVSEKTPTTQEMIEPAAESKPSDPVIPPMLPQTENEPADSASSFPAAALPATTSRYAKGYKYLYWGGAIAAIIILPLLGFVLFSPVMRARFYILRGNNETAAAIYEKLLERHPQRLELYSHLTQLYLLLGRQDAQAMKVFKIILQLNIPTPYRQQLNEIIAREQLADGKTKPDPLSVLKEAQQTGFSKKASGKPK